MTGPYTPEVLAGLAQPFTDQQKPVDPPPEPVAAPRSSDLLEAVRVAADERRANTRRDADELTRALRAARRKHTLGEIAQAAGITRARVHQLTRDDD